MKNLQKKTTSNFWKLILGCAVLLLVLGLASALLKKEQRVTSPEAVVLPQVIDPYRTIQSDLLGVRIIFDSKFIYDNHNESETVKKGDNRGFLAFSNVPEYHNLTVFSDSVELNSWFNAYKIPGYSIEQVSDLIEAYNKRTLQSSLSFVEQQISYEDENLERYTLIKESIMKKNQSGYYRFVDSLYKNEDGRNFASKEGISLDSAAVALPNGTLEYKWTLMQVNDDVIAVQTAAGNGPIYRSPFFSFQVL